MKATPHPTPTALTVDVIRASAARDRKDECTSLESDLRDVSTREEIENVLIETYLLCSERLED